MGGIRTAGDLVARVQLAKGLRLPEAKAYVAERLKVAAAELSDEIVMRELREDLGLGTVYMGYGAAPRGIEAKINIERLLDLPIRCVSQFRKKTGL